MLGLSSKLGWSCQLGYVVNNHGDGKSPTFPFQLAEFFMAVIKNVGDPNNPYVRPGMTSKYLP